MNSVLYYSEYQKCSETLNSHGCGQFRILLMKMLNVAKEYHTMISTPEDGIVSPLMQSASLGMIRSCLDKS